MNVVLDRMPIGPIQSYTYSMVGADHFIYCIFEPSAPPAPEPEPPGAPLQGSHPPASAERVQRALRALYGWQLIQGCAVRSQTRAQETGGCTSQITSQSQATPEGGRVSALSVAENYGWGAHE